MTWAFKAIDGRGGAIRATAMAVLVATSPLAAEDGSELPRLTLTRLDPPPVVDGRLDDAAWRGEPLPVDEFVSYNPVHGETLAQKTRVWAGYDASSLYFAFECLDPEPDKIRANLSRRDRLWNDDWVGVSLDAMGTRQGSLELFINPSGVQADMLATTSGGEDSAPDWVWDSAGQRTAGGYVVEVRVPFKSLRFKAGPEVRMGVLFVRRVSRLGLSGSWPRLVPGRTLFDRHATLVLHDLKPPLTLELMPAATYSVSQARLDPDRFGDADGKPDAGIGVKYGVTSSVTVEGTLNPDFSQVESDAFQVEVNRRVPNFFSEKRPFFMEGMGTFELAGAGEDAFLRTAVHTRRIVDPQWGAKVSGTVGRVTFASLAAADQAPGRVLAGEDHPFAGRRKSYLLGRALYDLGRSSYVGGFLASTEFGDGHNRVAAADVSKQAGEHHRWSATVLASDTRSPDGAETRSGLAGQAMYTYDTRRWVVVSQVEHYDRDFRMDTAFLSQVGLTSGWTFAAVSFYPDAEKHPWFKRWVPFVYSRYGRDRLQGGHDWFVLPGIRMHFTRQGFLRIDSGRGREPWAGREFDTSLNRAMGGAQLTRWLHVMGRAAFGRAIFYDPEAPFVGRSRSAGLELTFQPNSKLNQYVGLTRVRFDDLDGGRVFAVDVVNSRTTLQFDKHFFVRGIVQYDSSRRRILTDLLASWELMPGTVVYAGYGSLLERQEWDGTGWHRGRGDYVTTRRGLFFKASYVHRF